MSAAESENVSTEVDQIERELELLIDSLKGERDDLAVAVEKLLDVEKNDKTVDDITLPFNSEEDELTFIVGASVGALVEAIARIEMNEDDDYTDADSLEIDDVC